MAIDHPNCPLPATHRRLVDVHDLWHDCLGSYHEPRQFRRNLNSLMQELRNVTFMLQSEQRSIPEFDKWYGRQRERMRSDPVLRWAVAARNRVVKGGDLAAKSTAKIDTIDGWYDPPSIELDVPPLLTAPEIAARVRDLVEDRIASPEAALRVERRWVVDELPNEEILEAVAHCFAVVADVVDEAHYRSLVAMDTDQISTSKQVHRHQIRPPLCMQVSREARTAWIQASTGQLTHLHVRRRRYTETDRPEIQRRVAKYGIDWASVTPRDPPQTSDDLFVYAEMVLDLSKRFLVVDGTHRTIVHLIAADGEISLRQISAEERTDYFMLVREIANDLARFHWTQLVEISEVWRASPSDWRPGMRGVADVPERAEALQVVAAHCDGSIKVWITPFVREPGVKLRDTIVFERADVAPNFLEPIMRVWREWRSGSG